MTGQRRDDEELYATTATPPAGPCECGSTTMPVAMKPRRGSAWWDDPSPFWRCAQCGQYRGEIYDVRYARDDSATSRGATQDAAPGSPHVEAPGSAGEPSEAATPPAAPRGSTLRWSIGAGGPVVAEGDAAGWRLIVQGAVHVSSDESDDLCGALRQLALSDPELARDAFGVVVNCRSWEDDYTEHHGEDALPFEDWLERISTEGLSTHIDEDGELYYAPG